MRNQTERKSQIARARTLREGSFLLHSNIVKSFTALVSSVAEHVAEFDL